MYWMDGWFGFNVYPLFRDNILNITSFYSRKVFYALNEQVIVDDKKRVLWVSYSHKEVSHDSSSFRATKLYAHLKKILVSFWRKDISYLVILHIV